VSNGAGDGGALTLQAGRSILLQADIVTDNGNLWLIANDDLANGVVDVDRNTGAAEIFMSDEASIDAGTGTVTVEMRLGEGRNNSDSGELTLTAITAGDLTVLAPDNINLQGAINLAKGGTALIRADEDKLGDGTIDFSGGGSLSFGDD